MVIRILFLMLCAIFWRLGGSVNKGFRRYGCPALIGVMCVFTQNWLGLLSVPLLVGAYSLGYGPSSALMKIFKSKYLVRAICGLAYGLASAPLLWGNWTALGYDVALCVSFVTLAGNQRFHWEDEREEAGIGAIVNFMKLWA